VVANPVVTDAVPVKLKSLKVVKALPPIVLPVPVIVTVPLPAVKVPPLFVQSPATVRFVLAVNVPVVNVIFPVTDMVAGALKSPWV